jgi:hypothetical protein
MQQTQVEITIPEKWNIKDPQGNQALKRKARSFVNKLDKAKKTGNHVKVISVVAQYFKSYKRACGTKICKEALSDEVRNLVYSFAVSVATTQGVSESTVKELWESENC